MVFCIMISYEYKIWEYLFGIGKNFGCGIGCGVVIKLDWKKGICCWMWYNVLYIKVNKIVSKIVF